MVYIYVCKRFKVTMEMVSGRDGDWVNNLLQFYCKHTRLQAILERAEINPMKRMTTNCYDSSSDVFKINLVYKDTSGIEHELKWLIKVTRSDLNETADTLLRHEMQVFSGLMNDLINIVKQKAAGRLEGSRLTHTELINTPEFIFEETSHQADVLRNVLVLDNLEEKMFCPVARGGPLNLSHMKVMVKAIAKFHAVTLTYKKAMFDSFVTHSAQVKAKKKMDDVEIEGENRVLTGRMGLFARFPFLTQRLKTMSHLVKNREKFLDMYQMLLKCVVPEESHLVDTFEYIRLSTDDILRMDEHVEHADYEDNQLDSIALGVLEARSFLFQYVEDENNKENNAKKGNKVQRSQSARHTNRASFQHHNKSPVEKPKVDHHHHQDKPHSKVAKAAKSDIPAQPKCPKMEKQMSLPGGGGVASKFQNKFLQNVKGKSKDDEKVPLTNLKKTSKASQERDPNEPPITAALVNGKYVTYTRVTRDLAVLLFTTADSLVRRFYFIKLIECYVETLGITLGQLGVDTDSFGMNYHSVIKDFQQHVLYGFLVSVLVAMANTSESELKKCCAAENMDVDDDDDKETSTTDQEAATMGKFVPLTDERIEYLLDLMRDVASYVESKDFELGLPITNFGRYHELWSMNYGSDVSEYEDEEYDDDE